MRIDWKAIPSGPAALRYPLPEVTDWTDPTHVPLMVCDALELVGTTSCALTSGELTALNLVEITLHRRPNDRLNVLS